jgi:hypothetical protein
MEKTLKDASRRSDASISNFTTFDALNLKLKQIMNDFKCCKARNEENIKEAYRHLNQNKDDLAPIERNLDRVFEQQNKLLKWKKEIDTKLEKLEKDVGQNK